MSAKAKKKSMRKKTPTSTDIINPATAKERGRFAKPMQEKTIPSIQVMNPANGNSQPMRVTSERMNPARPMAFAGASGAGRGIGSL